MPSIMRASAGRDEAFAEVCKRHKFLRAGVKIFERDASFCEFSTENHRETRARFACIAEQLANISRRLRTRSNMETRAPQLHHEARKLILRKFATCRDDECIWPRKKCRAVIRKKLAIAQDVGEHDIAHAESAGWHLRTAEKFDKPVVTTAAGDGTFCPRNLVNLEDRACVVRQSAHDANVD